MKKTIKFKAGQVHPSWLIRTLFNSKDILKYFRVYGTNQQGEVRYYCHTDVQVDCSSKPILPKKRVTNQMKQLKNFIKSLDNGKQSD